MPPDEGDCILMKGTARLLMKGAVSWCRRLSLDEADCLLQRMLSIHEGDCLL